MTSDAERSMKQVIAYRERLANSIDATEESHRHLSVSDRRSAAAKADAEAEEAAEEEVVAIEPPSPPNPYSGPPPKMASSPRTRNAGFFD